MMDAEQERAVWERVRGQRSLPLRECAQCVGLMRYLWKRGVCRDTLSRLLRKQVEQLDTLRGLVRLRGDPEEPWVAADPQGMDVRQAALQCAELLRGLAVKYALGEGDAGSGGLFRRFAEETWGMFGEMVRVYQKMGE